MLHALLTNEKKNVEKQLNIDFKHVLGTLKVLHNKIVQLPCTTSPETANILLSYLGIIVVGVSHSLDYLNTLKFMLSCRFI